MEKPKKLQAFLDMIMDEAKRDSLADLMEHNNIDSETDFYEIRDWFKQFDLKV